MSETRSNNGWKYLARKPGSVYKQLFLRPWNIAARTLYGRFMSEEQPRTPEQIAEDYSIPLDAVLEAIAYCETNPPEIREDWEKEEKLEELMGTKDPEYIETGRTKRVSLADIARLERE